MTSVPPALAGGFAALINSSRLRLVSARNSLQTRPGGITLSARTDNNAVVGLKRTERQTKLAGRILRVVEDAAISKVGINAERRPVCARRGAIEDCEHKWPLTLFLFDEGNGEIFFPIAVE